jgi:hypothetical protein
MASSLMSYFFAPIAQVSPLGFESRRIKARVSRKMISFSKALADIFSLY